MFAQEGANLSSITTVIKRILPGICRLQNAMESEQQLFRVMWEKEEDVAAIFDCATQNFGRLTFSSTMQQGRLQKFTDITLEDWNQCLNDNLTGQFLMSREFARRVIPAKRKGWIVNILSKHPAPPPQRGVSAMYATNPEKQD